MLQNVSGATPDVPDATPVAALKDPFKPARVALAIGDLATALKSFLNATNSATEPELRALALFGAGLTSARMGQDKDAQSFFEQASQIPSPIDDYVHYFLGLSYEKTGDDARAREQFTSLMNSPRSTPLRIVDAQFEMGSIAVSEKKWSLAANEYRVLLKKYKNTERYPDVIWQLMQIERKSAAHPVGRGCKWAKELYAKYPSYPQVSTWGFDLASSVVDGKPVGCQVTRKDQETRIRRLQWGGEFDRALKELTDLKARTPESEHYSVDSMIANHLISDGQVDEALKLLMPYYNSEGSRPGYLLLLAKATSRAGQPEAAIGAYEKAYRMAPRGKTGKQALFQAAFMSYQFQDYDGATRKFEQFVKVFPGSAMTRDARWHLAWIRYLKADYAGAYGDFAKLTGPQRERAPASHRRRHAGKGVYDEGTADRARYWMAMSLMRMNRIAEARPIFEKISKDPGYGYYAIVASYRLASLPKPVLTGKAAPSPTPDAKAIEKAIANATPDPNTVPPPLSATTPVAAADEAAADEAADGGSGVDGESDDDTPDDSVVVENDDAQLGDSANFNDVALSKRFERARDLNMIGLNEYSREELYEIERRTRKPADLRALMNEYQVVQSYYRASYLGETTFGPQRVRYGMQGARFLWEFAYPKAFERTVMSTSQKNGIPEELVWGIMRAESHYREDARSPVGALGLMQLMPFTSAKVAGLLDIKNFDIRDTAKPDTNIVLGARYLKRLSEEFDGRIPLVAAGYNAGPHRVWAWLKSFGRLDMDEFIEHIPYIETRNYAKRVVRNCQIYNLLYKNGSRDMSWLVKPIGIKVADSNPQAKEIW